MDFDVGWPIVVTNKYKDYLGQDQVKIMDGQHN
jgi:hypothetical protein